MDGLKTFNISTCASFVAAGAGVRIAKHGGRSISSSSGSADVLESLGVNVSIDNIKMKELVDSIGIGFMFAPNFHPAMKHVAPIRKELGLKTFFNILGPLVNPSFPKNQIVGVYSLELARLYSYLFQKTKKNYAIIHSLDGYDEISLTGATKIISRKEENVYEPNDIGLTRSNPKSISGGNSIKESAEIFINILNNKGTNSQNEVIFANSGLAISTALGISFNEGIEKAKESLLSNQALKTFNNLKKLC